VATGRKRLLKATVAYHGANEWFTPIRAGVTDEDRANISEFAYNDIASLEEMVRAHSDDLAAIILTPFRHDTFVPQEDVDPAFARRARELATAHGAVLILDEVRTGFRLDVRGAWEGIGVRPDITAFSKAIANGHALSAITGGEPLREAAAQIYATGSFWYSAVPMAAGIATISAAREIDAPAVIRASGERLKAGFEAQAAAAGVPARLTGPTQMPLLVFEDDPEYAKAFAFTGAAIRHGVLMHPWHNMFLSTAHSFDVIDDTLERTQRAFDEMFLSTP
jgi:glutamate-1-semialdehyde 2,1-aminomutase